MNIIAAVLASFLIATATWSVQPVSAADFGAAANVVSSYVDRDSTRSGPSVQPSVWIHLPSAFTLASAWSSVRLESPRFDAVSFDTRTGGRVGSRWWIGGLSRTTWFDDHIVEGVVGYDTTGVGADASIVPVYGPVRYSARFRVEIGWQATLFRPPYRPTYTMTYDLADEKGLMSVFAIPYTIRLPWIPPATISPELVFRSFSSGRDVFRFQHVSVTGLIEQHWRSLVIIPIASLVIPRDRTPGEWHYWVGLHLGAGL